MEYGQYIFFVTPYTVRLYVIWGHQAQDKNLIARQRKQKKLTGNGSVLIMTGRVSPGK